jgi:hypothetical protein
VDCAGDDATTPRNDLGRAHARGEVERRERGEAAGGAEVALPEGRRHVPFDDRSCVGGVLRARERFADEREPEIAVDGRKAFARRCTHALRASSVGDTTKRVRTVERAAGQQGLVERQMSLETGAMGQKELERYVLARRSARFRKNIGKSIARREKAAPSERQRRHRLRQAREIEDRIERERTESARPTCSTYPPATGPRGPSHGYVTSNAIRHEAARQLIRARE